MLAKCFLAILELNSNQRLRDKTKLNLSSSAHVVHTTAKQIISRRGKNENFGETFKKRKMHLQSV